VSPGYGAAKVGLNAPAIKGERGTGFEKRGDNGPFECGNCEYFERGNSCHQRDMMAKSKQPRHSDGSVVVAAADCCEYLDRVGTDDEEDDEDEGS
jgi:hypothetical protein